MLPCFLPYPSFRVYPPTRSSRRTPLCLGDASNDSNTSKKPTSNNENKLDRASRELLSRSLSDTDRMYLSKVRDRIYAAATRAANTHSDKKNINTDTEASMVASLPDDIEEMENLMFNRAPVNAGQVPLFGGWLDENAAGRKAGKQQQTNSEEIETPEKIFAAGMRLFNRGLYRDAVSLFANATEAAGTGGRKGGHYSLWHAQALDAAGEKAHAENLLLDLQAHADGDVRKVARELHFIMTAPALELDRSSFLDIPPLEEGNGSRDFSQVLAGFKKGDRRAEKSKTPEPYSIEWYMEKKRPPKVEDNTVVEAIVLAGLICCTLAYMIGHSPS